MKSILTLALIATFNTVVFGNQLNDGIDPTGIWTKWTKEYKAYPEAAVEQKKEGTVYVSFQIAEDGTAENIIVEHGVSEELNEKAIEIVKTMPKEHLIEENVSGESRFILPVKFTIQ